MTKLQEQKECRDALRQETTESKISAVYTFSDRFAPSRSQVFELSSDSRLYVTGGRKCTEIDLSEFDPEPELICGCEIPFKTCQIILILAMFIVCMYAPAGSKLPAIVAAGVIVSLAAVFFVKTSRYRFHSLNENDRSRFLDIPFERHPSFFRSKEEQNAKEFAIMVCKSIAACFKFPPVDETKENRERRCLELMDEKILTNIETSILIGGTEDPRVFRILELLKMDGYISDEEYVEFTAQRIFPERKKDE